MKVYCITLNVISEERLRYFYTNFPKKSIPYTGYWTKYQKGINQKRIGSITLIPF